MRSGHVLIGCEGQLLGIDRGFSEIMQAPPDSLIGRRVLDVTAPADRTECAAAIARLQATRQPFEISKRFIRDDSSLVWATNTVSMVDHGRDAGMIVATVAPIVDAVGDRAPARLLDSARVMVDVRTDRSASFGGALFSDTAWDTMLAAYIAEAEGRSITTAALAERLGISRTRADRWIQVLIGQRAIEIETRNADPCAPKSFRLTALTHARLEDHLARAGDMRSAPSPYAAAQGSSR